MSDIRCSSPAAAAAPPHAAPASQSPSSSSSRSLPLPFPASFPSSCPSSFPHFRPEPRPRPSRSEPLVSRSRSRSGSGSGESLPPPLRGGGGRGGTRRAGKEEKEEEEEKGCQCRCSSSSNTSSPSRPSSPSSKCGDPFSGTNDLAVSEPALVGAWQQLAGFLDAISLVRIACACPALLATYLGEGIGAILRARWDAKHLRGSSQDLVKMDARLALRRCSFLPHWTGTAGTLSYQKIREAAKRRPEALHFLWETRFLPGEAAAVLTAPLAYLDAQPAASLQLGTTSVTFSLRLLCVAESYFDRERPLRRVLLRLGCEIDHGPTLFRGGRPGPEGHQICGEGHRWCAVAQTIEEQAPQPLFCSLRESYLRPAWRNPSVMKSTHRHMMHRCEHLEGLAAVPKLESEPLRLLLTVYRCEDDEDPDEPSS